MEHSNAGLSLLTRRYLSAALSKSLFWESIKHPTLLFLLILFTKWILYKYWVRLKGFANYYFENQS
jgi:energy-coupling factor transporter transmembrane protein EcfT